MRFTFFLIFCIQLISCSENAENQEKTINWTCEATLPVLFYVDDSGVAEFPNSESIQSKEIIKFIKKNKDEILRYTVNEDLPNLSQYEFQIEFKEIDSPKDAYAFILKSSGDIHCENLLKVVESNIERDYHEFHYSKFQKELDELDFKIDSLKPLLMESPELMDLLIEYGERAGEINREHFMRKPLFLFINPPKRTK